MTIIYLPLNISHFLQCQQMLYLRSENQSLKRSKGNISLNNTFFIFLNGKKEGKKTRKTCRRDR